ncbi:MAG: DNA (cytosine-5-)-methyltransferase [Methylococcaceae bacterium]
MSNKIKVVELFAGVGGFRLGLEGWQNKSASSNYSEAFNSDYQVIWSNQFEPSTKAQHASLVYENRWGKENHINADIATIATEDLPDCDLLVGGFPCQDYSVATSLKNSKGLKGKKGVLWWEIERLLNEKTNKPRYIFLENVDRLLKSPSNQRGRDFAIMLKSLDDLGYAVEWRVINAADYGMPQRRRRIFLVAYHQSTLLYQQINKQYLDNWLLAIGTLATAFPVKVNQSCLPIEIKLTDNIVTLSDSFNKTGKNSPFENAGVMINSRVLTLKTEPNYQGKSVVLGDILQHNEVDDSFYIKETDLEKWRYLKGGKKEIRTTAEGYEYNYSEGGMIFPDLITQPSRTIITGEGGISPSRFKHVIETEQGLRRLLPIELERLNMFPDNHTKLEGCSDTKRAFFMGNALVVGIVEKIGIALAEKIKSIQDESL